MAEQKTGHEEEFRVLATSINEKNAVLNERTADLESLSQALKEKEASLEETRAGILNAMTASAAEKSTLSSLRSRISQIDEQDERGMAEKQDLERKLQDSIALLAAKERELEEITARKNAAQEERMQVIERLEQAPAAPPRKR